MRVEASGEGAVAVTPSDTVNISLPPSSPYTRGIYVGVTGDLSVLMVDGSTATFVGVAAGVIHPIAVVRVNETDTTATNLIAVY